MEITADTTVGQLIPKGKECGICKFMCAGETLESRPMCHLTGNYLGDFKSTRQAIYKSKACPKPPVKGKK